MKPVSGGIRGLARICRATARPSGAANRRTVSIHWYTRLTATETRRGRRVRPDTKYRPFFLPLFLSSSCKDGRRCMQISFAAI
jgi:hypothetical protein